MISRLPLRTALVAGLCATPAAAGPDTMLDLISVDRLATLGAQWAITALRGVAQVSYADMELRPLQGRMTLTGLDIAPYDPDFAGCAIHLDRAVIATAPLDQITTSTIDIDLTGATVAQACLDATGDNPLTAFGITDLVLDRGKLSLDYSFASGALTADLQAVSSDLVEIRSHMAFDYFAVNIDDEEPVADFAYAQVELRDLGLMALLAPTIPPEFGDAEALAAGMREGLVPRSAPVRDGVAVPEPGTEAPRPAPGNKAAGPKPPAMDAPETAAPMPGPDPALADVTAMIDQMAGELAGFVNAPGRLVLTLAPPVPVRLSEETTSDFVAFARTMQPELSAGERPEPTPVTAVDERAIAAWLGGDGPAIPEADALRVARALLSGIGAPRDPAMAMQLLGPLLDADNAEAIALALDELDALDPGAAYRIARRAAATGDRAAFARLDRLERGLGLMQAVALQEQDATPPSATAADTAHGLREKGFAALTGLGAPRRYAAAYYYGLLALAGGDLAAAALVDEVEAMGNTLDPDAAEAWADLLDGARTRASASWFAAH